MTYPLKKNSLWKKRKDRHNIKKKEIDRLVTNSSDEDTEYTSNHNLQSRIPCYRLVKPQPQRATVAQQNPQNQNKFCEAAKEFCQPVRLEVEKIQDREEAEDDPQMVEEGPDPVDEMDNGNIGTGEELRRSQRKERPTERFTYDTLGHLSNLSWCANVNGLLPSQPPAVIQSFVPFPYYIQSQP